MAMLVRHTWYSWCQADLSMWNRSSDAVSRRALSSSERCRCRSSRTPMAEAKGGEAAQFGEQLLTGTDHPAAFHLLLRRQEERIVEVDRHVEARTVRVAQQVGAHHRRLVEDLVLVAFVLLGAGGRCGRDGLAPGRQREDAAQVVQVAGGETYETQT
ncbi:hypothetical protein VR46_39595 [Streptomyces sp. NRRL S-444]|nr:hypothetical protein VR46_39595 [Streptomyces sp. NRRL S-444]